MDLQTEDLLEFCAYYTLSKSMARLPLSTYKDINIENSQSNQKQTKIGRRKMQVVQTKKQQRIFKPKIQQVKKTSQKKSVSPIEKINFEDLKQANIKNHNLDYFMNHMSDPYFGQTYTQMPQKTRLHQNQSFYYKNLEQSTQNYETFGKNETFGKEFQTFDEKTKRKNNKYITSAINGFNDPRQNCLNKFSATQQVKDLTQDNSWLYGNQAIKKGFIRQSPKIPFVVPYNQLNQINESKLNYSPSARNYSPGLSSAISSSWIKSSPINESNLSISRTKHQRKKSERPFYDASKLTLRTQNEPFRDIKQDQLLLSQSDNSINDNPVTNNKKQLIELNKRQTSITAPSSIFSKMQPRNETKDVDLDDYLGQTLSDLQRQPPVAFQVKIRSIRQ